MWIMKFMILFQKHVLVPVQVIGGRHKRRRTDDSRSRSRSWSHSRSRHRTSSRERARRDKREKEEHRRRLGNSMVLEAERSKAKILQPSGNDDFVYHGDQYFHNFSAHVDKSLREKIERGEFVDLGKLLIKNRFGNEDENRLEFVNKNGKSYFMPMSDKATPAITNFRRWEQAFRVYSGIYTSKHQKRANELYQYVETISIASQTYVWDNVYQYDQLFRHLMAQFPDRKWGIMYHHGWLMTLKDHLPKNQNGQFGSFSSKSKFKKKRDEICWKYKKTCKFGEGCRFEHKCSYYNKAGPTKICKLPHTKRKMNGKIQGFRLCSQAMYGSWERVLCGKN